MGQNPIQKIYFITKSRFFYNKISLTHRFDAFTRMQAFENPSSRSEIESINRWLDFFWRRRRKIFNPRLTSRKITCHLLWFRSRIFHRIDYCKYYFTIFLIEFDSIWFNNQIMRQLGVTTSNHWLYTSVTESNCISVFFLAKQWIRLIFECLFLESKLIDF